MKTIVIDPGHGGFDSGAVSPLGLKESDVVLKVCLQVRDKLRSNLGVRVLLTRQADNFVSLTGRALWANNNNADLFLSVHCNAASSPDASGFEVFTSPGQTNADAAAEHLFRRYAQRFPDLKQRTDYKDGDSDKEANFTVLSKTKAPAILLELEFIHTEKGHKFFTSSYNIDAISTVISNWILSEAKR